ncbi:MAG: magnesium transporter CorA [Clostridia bacterium]|nr:magnesium transporter CorA [Clostridia bacterium]
MAYYLCKECLEPCAEQDILQQAAPYVAAITFQEWPEKLSLFSMGIDLDPAAADPGETKAVVNYDSLTGTIAMPDRKRPGSEHRFAFALDEKGVVFLDDTGYVDSLLQEIRRTRRWRMPCLERFLYDFLELLILDDRRYMDETEKELNAIEEMIVQGEGESTLTRINEIRGELLDLHGYYSQLIDLGQELEENENGFFQEEQLRYFDLFTSRVERLQSDVTSLREFTVQLRDLMQAQNDARQNHIMTVLTVVTTIFMPLTLITGWYGMNFEHMPELSADHGYTVVITLSLLIVILSLLYFKKKKWL